MAAPSDERPKELANELRGAGTGAGTAAREGAGVDMGWSGVD
jgi:hypothetical protein